MRRLEIAVPGTSQAMAELAQELELHGHGVVVHESLASHDAVDVLIDDGTVPSGIQARLRLQVRVTLQAIPGQALPRPVVFFYDGTQRLLARQMITEHSDGNGQSLRLHTLAAVVEDGARLVSQFSRDETCFDHWPTVQTDPADQPLQALDVLEPLAFEHRLNRPPVPWLLAAAEVPVMHSIEQRMLADAMQPALWVDGQLTDYKSLRGLALRLQHAMLEKLRQACDQPLVIGVCLPKSAPLYAAILAVLGCGACLLYTSDAADE